MPLDEKTNLVKNHTAGCSLACFIYRETTVKGKEETPKVIRYDHNAIAASSTVSIDLCATRDRSSVAVASGSQDSRTNEGGWSAGVSMKSIEKCRYQDRARKDFWFVLLGSGKICLLTLRLRSQLHETSY